MPLHPGGWVGAVKLLAEKNSVKMCMTAAIGYTDIQYNNMSGLNIEFRNVFIWNSVHQSSACWSL